MRCMTTFVMTLVGWVLVVSPAGAELVQVDSENTSQDPLNLSGWVHEIGDWQVFPQCQQIECLEWEETSETACEGLPQDDPDIPNVVVAIRNVCSVARPELYYVSDPETGLSNIDGMINNVGMMDGQQSFRIDAVGMNKPLIFESLNLNGIFEPDEIWHFIIQDYQNGITWLDLPPNALGSIGIAGNSFTDQVSSGSIITPEPATLALMGLGAAALAARRRRKQ